MARIFVCKATNAAISRFTGTQHAYDAHTRFPREPDARILPKLARRQVVDEQLRKGAKISKNNRRSHLKVTIEETPRVATHEKTAHRFFFSAALVPVSHSHWYLIHSLTHESPIFAPRFDSSVSLSRSRISFLFLQLVETLSTAYKVSNK